MAAPNHSIPKILTNPIKGSSDWRKYRALSLPNGITCVLVNDKESKTTSCAVSVGTGASADPRELSGLAHFTEHMSFLGSEAYPKENEFKQYLSRNGGRSNASTSMSQTCYKFDVVAEHAEKVIDIFSNFFIAPLFTQSGTNREVNAVDSENSKNKTNDGRRRLQILKALADPQHHYSKFSTGNMETLPTTDGEKAVFVREALLAFHKRHYRPDNMTVVVVGPQDLNMLEEWIVPRFARILDRFTVKNREDMTEAEKLVDDSAMDLPDDSFGAPPVPFHSAFRPQVQGGMWPLLLTTRPLQSVRKLYLNFPLPSIRELGDQSPFSLICHLLGHEGPGSCFAALQDAELITALFVGPRLTDVDQSLLQISVSLSEKGEGCWEQVVDILFEYCQMLYGVGKSAKEGEEDHLTTLQRIWDEILSLRSLHFHQTSPNQAYSFAPNLANRVRMYGTEKCLSLGSLLDESKDSIPLDSFVSFMEKIKPENCIIERSSKAAWDKLKPDCDNVDEGFGFQVEKWYGVSYHLSPINQCTIDLWRGVNSAAKADSIALCNRSLHLPRVNNHIPRDLSLCSDLDEEGREGPRISKPMDPPNLLIDNEFGRLWHRLDDRYCLPKSSISFLVRSPEVKHVYKNSEKRWYFDTGTSLHSAILISVFRDALAQQTYDADLAGLNWYLSSSSSGLMLHFSGYSSANNEHLSNFALQIISQFFSSQEKSKDSFLSEQHFRTNKDKYTRNLKSFMDSKRADTYAQYYTDLLLSKQGKGIDHSIKSMESISIGSLEQHHKRLISAMGKTECIFAGNVSQKDARQFFSSAQTIMTKARGTSSNKSIWIPGTFERKLEVGEEIQLHFQSQNKEEQNGSVIITYQSMTPSFKGSKLSKSASLVRSAAIRTISHMLREPLFNQLRTKEQLGYIVGSYYNNTSSSISNQVDLSSGYTEDMVTRDTTMIDSIVVNVLSKKVPPPIITQRVDEFLGTFHEKLRGLPDVELKSHTDALSKKLLKPKQKLGDEVGMLLNKIKHHAPEVLHEGSNLPALPWESNRELAEAIQSLKRNDLLEAWDNVIAGKESSRVVSHIYGSSFPLPTIKEFQARSSKKVVELYSTHGILEKRQMLVQYSEKNVHRQKFILIKRVLENKFGIALGLMGASCLMYTMHAWNRKDATGKTTSYRFKK